MDKLIISVATTGSITTRQETPYIPLTPVEIADDVYRCWQAGASVAHIHVRDEKGREVGIRPEFETTTRVLPDLLAETVKNHPDRTAAIFYGSSLRFIVSYFAIRGLIPGTWAAWTGTGISISWTGRRTWL